MSETLNNSSQNSTIAAIPAAVNVTDSAAQKVRELIDEEGNASLKLRVYITGGGCSGFQYGFSFDEAKAEDDMEVFKEATNSKGESSSVCVLIDAMSLQYLVGAEIDYVSDLDGERFIIRNPQAKTTCGCGSSFDV